MERLNPRARSDEYGSRFQRRHSTILANIVPWLSVVIASILPQYVVATAFPMIPPLGFLMLLGWRLVRPGLLPTWAGFPLGLVDDLFSGQPFGFAILFWSLTMLLVELLETRFPWRNFTQDWFTAGLAATLYCLAGVIFSGARLEGPLFIATLPQIMLSILLFPILARLVARLDRLRLMRWRAIS